MDENVLTIDIEGNGMVNPLFCEYPAGKNWGAILKGTNAANMTRIFLPKKDEIIDMSAVEPGDAFEVGGDCLLANGRRIKDRQYWLILGKTDEDGQIFYRNCGTPAKVLKAMREFASANSIDANSPVVDEDGEISIIEDHLLTAA
ncbi:hypothetical protein [Georhizobium sp. MAB10]|uniref:hypothetical protein n=1 Tax=Georhizobium sp. MAB10 TaxID=3028319 RepID=UPI0038557F69